MLSRSRQGFTLIELLIVVAIIAILAAIAIPNFLNAQVRSKVSRVKAEMQTAATGIESYYVDNNVYPWYNNSLDDAAEGEFFMPINLTTPVAYLSSLTKEVFPNQSNEPGRPPYHPFHYLNGNQTPGRVAEVYESYYNEQPGAGNNRMWYVASHGPDIDDDEGEVQYDPTNGTTSDGDILRFGP